MHGPLYRCQPVRSRVNDAGDFFEAYAGECGLNVEQFRADRNSQEIEARVMADGQAGSARGVKNTPTLFLNGREVRSGFTKDSLQGEIEAALSAKKGS